MKYYLKKMKKKKQNIGNKIYSIYIFKENGQRNEKGAKSENEKDDS